jgi:hypothetical protein
MTFAMPIPEQGRWASTGGARGTMTSGRPLEHLIPNRACDRDVATVQCWIKCGQIFRKSQLGLTNGLDQTFES